MAVRNLPNFEKLEARFDRLAESLRETFSFLYFNPINFVLTFQKKKLKKLTHDEISKNRSTLETIHKVKKLPVYVILNSIRSNYNVGSIFRTSDGAMIEKLYLCGYTPHPPKPALSAGKREILKTALGSTESVNWEYVPDAKEVIKNLKKKSGVKIVALELTDSSKQYYKISPNDFPICLLIGNEITGVPQELIDMCDYSIEIPQYGIKQSLNVAVAYGIAIFELRKIFEQKSEDKIRSQKSKDR